jgi:hypothetical protein
MLDKLRNRWHRRRFDQLTRGILETAPVQVVDADWSIISMVSNSDVQMYLLSMKSFYSRIGRGKIVAIVDRDMPQQLRDTLRRHLVGIRFEILEDIDTGPCQRGGTWERIVYLLRHAESEYAIQVDCDTLAFGADLDEIVRCAESNRAFTLTGLNRHIASMREYAEDAQKMDTGYIGIVAEKLFDRYPDCDRLRYVRGSSGLAGFAAGAFPAARIEEFHEIMRGLVGDDAWRGWGTEQCASNFAVANSPDAVVLPHPKYANFWPGLQPGDYAFLHFFGTHRYRDDYFAMRGRQVIGELNAA